MLQVTLLCIETGIDNMQPACIIAAGKVTSMWIKVSLKVNLEEIRCIKKAMRGPVHKSNLGYGTGMLCK
ncbi:hypothetical protein XELAEV_18047303mg [Xenopus laevis]|uniref:Uncharacterized protein n=1 Tax=Xenopus laevis TaxID=8355 RepID=A0A974H1D1_XENLA|nr:hypothetical protein XELAEV_18047303mg [Xenopus laevis]